MHNKTTHPCGGTHPPHPPPPKNDVVSFPIPSLQPYRYNHDPAHHRHRISPPFMVTTTVTAAASSWLRNRRIRYIFLLLCSPLLLVLLFVSLPFLCAAEVCLRHRLWRKLVRDPDDDGDRLRRCEEGCCGDCNGQEEKGLLHRYLEDQLLLVGSMYDCGDSDDDDEDEQEQDDDSRRRVGDVENLCSSSNRIPLLR
ncbi:hypothetical protein RIF29_38230 [Crotalaria pallida]|uniref:Transmembrane protein n=1 Tax=Crotalaria pallida TaxID=3830 RepID=A0AAN9HNK9_CROPI